MFCFLLSSLSISHHLEAICSSICTSNYVLSNCMSSWSCSSSSYAKFAQEVLRNNISFSILVGVSYLLLEPWLSASEFCCVASTNSEALELDMWDQQGCQKHHQNCVAVPASKFWDATSCCSWLFGSLTSEFSSTVLMFLLSLTCTNRTTGFLPVSLPIFFFFHHHLHTNMFQFSTFINVVSNIFAMFTKTFLGQQGKRNLSSLPLTYTSALLLNPYQPAPSHIGQKYDQTLVY